MGDKYNAYQMLHLVASGKPQKAALDVRRVQMEADEGTDMPTGDILHVSGRALSAVLIEGHWLEIPANVLMTASDMLTGRTVYKDHKTYAENWCGTVLKSEWAEGDPAGIDIEIKVDAKNNPKIADGLTWQPNPPIKAFSVGMEVMTKKSHPQLDDYEFWMNRGREIDGEIVRSVVTEIMDIYEVSFVWEGADPNALVSDVRKLAKHEEDDVKHITAAIQAFVGGDVEAIQELTAHEKAGDIEKAIGQLVEFMTPEIEAIQGTEAKFQASTTDSAMADRWREKKLAEIRRCSALLGEGDDSASIRLAKRFAKGETKKDIDDLSALAESLAKRAEKDAPQLVCAKCGSAQLERRSSTAGETGRAQHTRDQVKAAGRY